MLGEHFFLRLRRWEEQGHSPARADIHDNESVSGNCYGIGTMAS